MDESNGGREWISKKELLERTGISYGQLYRWKRERLIPDSWFVKRSAVTGQETYFPRERVLERIRFIQENRDTCPLNRMRELLSPAAEARTYSAEQLSAFPAAAEEIALQRELVGAEELSFGQALCALLAARVRKENGCAPEGLSGLLAALNEGYGQGLLTRAGMSLLVIKGDPPEALVFEGEGRAALLGDEGARLWQGRLDDIIPRITGVLRTIAERDE